MSRQTTNASIASPSPFHGNEVRSAASSSSADSLRNPSSPSVALGTPYDSREKWIVAQRPAASAAAAVHAGSFASASTTIEGGTWRLRQASMMSAEPSAIASAALAVISCSRSARSVGIAPTDARRITRLGAKPRTNSGA